MNYLNFNLQILVANDSNVTNWQEHKLVCNCPFYLKNNLRKHNMALAAALKFVNIPLEERSLPMESKPKRGRRSHATKVFNKFISFYITKVIVIFDVIY
jgi:hypothetical protein